MENLVKPTRPRSITLNHSSTLNTALTPLSRLAFAVGMALSASSAWAADCVTLADSTYSCTQSAINENLSYTGTGLTGPVRINAGTTSFDGSLHLSDSDITAVGLHGLLVLGQGASVVLDGSNSITLSGTDDTAVLVMGQLTEGGHGSIVVNGHLDININRPGVTNSDGLEAHGFNSEISHHGTGTINTNGGNGIVTSATNNTAVLVDGGAILNIAENNNDGIRAKTTLGNVNVNSNATITTTGDYGFGVRTNINGGSGNIDITNTGGISTSGLSAHGLYATTAANSTGSGKITINNSGNITTSNRNTTTVAGAHAIYALVTNAGANSGGVEVNQTGGTLKTTGNDSHGIFVLSNAVSGDLNVNLSDTIIDVKSRNSDGIDVQRLSSGDINQVSNVNINIITNGGEIKVLSDPTFQGSSNFGIVARLYDAAAGNITLINNGTKISTGLGLDGLAPGSSALDAAFVNTTATGDISIFNSGELNTKGVNAVAIGASNNGSGKITIINEGQLNIGGYSAGIRANSAGAGDVFINHKVGATVTSTGVQPSGIAARMDAITGYKNSLATGNITILVDGDVTIDTAQRGAGAYAQHQGVGNATIIGTGNITSSGTRISDYNIYSYGLAATVSDSAVAAGDAFVGYSNGTVSTGGDQAFALYAGVVGKSGHSRVENSGTLITTGTASSAIWARNVTTDAVGRADVLNSGNITTSGELAHGILASASNAEILVVNSGEINIGGIEAFGIFANLNTEGKVNITNSGEITTTGLTSRGIYAHAPITATSADIEVVNTGNITSVDHGILISSGAVSGNAKAYVTGSRIEALGVGVAILASESLAHFELKDSQVIAHGNKSSGVIVSRDLNATTVNSTTVNISNSTIDNRDSYGGDALTVSSGIIGDTFIHLDAKTYIYGGWKNGTEIATGIGFNGANRDLTNEGVIEALSDWAIRGSRFTAVGAQSTINNYGSITGYMSGDDGDSVFNNYSSNSWNIRNFADTNGDGVRDTKAVAISDFGLGYDIFNNEATGMVRLAAVTGDINTPDLTGEHPISGALSIANAGIVQGQLLNLNRFENRGTIDLSENGLAGDVLLITNSATAGTNGNGQFMADGGRLILDTILNNGDINSLSDILVVDNVVAGSDTTRIIINRVGGDGALTSGDGIKVIEVLGDADTGSFALGNVVKSGIYEYTLHEGSVTTIGDNSLYLRSTAEQINPDVGSYLANQTAATGLFMHTLHDRLGEPQYYQNYKAEDKAIPAVWIRAVAGNSKNEAAGGWLKQHSENTLVHLGGELANWTGNGDNRYHLGVMGAYGRSETKTTSKATGSRVNSTIDGYGIGAYLTWYQDPSAVEGWYTDIWSMYNWFNNQTEGSDDYDSQSSTTSIEAGYATKLTALENYDWMLEPQVQVAYNYYSADEIQDHNGLNITDSDANGVATRLGMRTYLRPSTDKNGAQPFVELNWLYNSASNSMIFNGETIADDTPKNRYEAKVGVQGEMTENLQVYSHIALQWGEHNYQSAQGQVGVRYRF